MVAKILKKPNNLWNNRNNYTTYSTKRKSVLLNTVLIIEMERLLQLNKDNPEIFKKVILEKIKREKEHSNEGRSLDQILQIFGVEGNAYLKKPQFDAYKVFTAVTEDGEW